MSAETQARHKLSTTRRWVVKIGSALLTNNGRGLDRDRIGDWVGQIAALQERGSAYRMLFSYLDWMVHFRC